jgi:hypothetical protein
MSLQTSSFLSTFLLPSGGQLLHRQTGGRPGVLSGTCLVLVTEDSPNRHPSRSNLRAALNLCKWTLLH